MKLYLSSYRIPNMKAFSEFVGKAPSQIRLALVLNAQDYKPKDMRAEKLEGLLKYFSNLGFYVEEIDLLDYTNDNNGLFEKLKGFDVVWLNGGNVYYVRWVIEKSNAEKVLKEVLAGGVVYGGDSAGAIIAGPTLKHYETADDPNIAPTLSYESLGLVDVSILPHWGSEKYHHVLENIEDCLQKDGFKTVRLSDFEYLLVDDGAIRLEK